MTTQHSIKLLALLVGLGAGFHAAATEVYTWVDEQGITHFSQSPPADADIDAQTLQVPSGQAIEPSEHVETMIELANQLEASRLAREQAAWERRLAREQLALEEKRLEQLSAQPPVSAYRYPVSVYPKARHRRHHGPRHRPRKSRDCAPHCAEAGAARNPPFHRSGRHGTSHLRPYKSLPSGP